MNINCKKSDTETLLSYINSSNNGDFDLKRRIAELENELTIVKQRNIYLTKKLSDLQTTVIAQWIGDK